MAPLEDEFFIPAKSDSEATTGIFSLVGRQPDQSRGEKRALIALRDAVGLDIDIVRTNAQLGRLLANALDVQRQESRHTKPEQSHA